MKTIVCKHNVIWANNAAAENAGLMTTSVAFSSSLTCLLILILSKWEIIFMVFYLGRVSHFLFLNTDTEWILNFTSIIAFYLAGRNLKT